MACYDTAVGYGTPFISGKDSMFNDFKGFDENGKPIIISIPPTLLISSIAVMDDAGKAVSLDAKVPGDIVYVIGENKAEMGGSEYFAMVGEQTRRRGFVGNNVPVVDVMRNRRVYERFPEAVEKGLIASAQGVRQGGLAVALAKTAMGGRLGMEVYLQEFRGIPMPEYAHLFSESMGRIVATVDERNTDRFEDCMSGIPITKIGYVRDDERFIVGDTKGKTMIETDVDKMLDSYRRTFKGY